MDACRSFVSFVFDADIGEVCAYKEDPGPCEMLQSIGLRCFFVANVQLTAIRIIQVDILKIHFLRRLAVQRCIFSFVATVATYRALRDY